MRRRFSKILFTAASVFYIVYVTLPIFSQLLSRFHVSIQLASIAVLVATLVACPKAFNSKSTLWLGAYIAVLALYVLIGKSLTISSISDEKGNVFKFLMEMAFILPSFALMSGWLYFKDQMITAILGLTVIASFGVSFLYLIPMTLIDHNILRIAMDSEEAGLEGIIGAPRYSLMHAYVILVAPLMYGLRFLKGRDRWIVAILAVMLVYMILHTYIATTIVILVVTVFAGFILEPKNEPKMLSKTAISVVVVALLLVTGVIGELLAYSGSFFEDSYAEGKYQDLLQFVTTGQASSGNAVQSRQSLHSLSWESFFRNPIVGTSKVGGHSNLLDRLGGMGLICFIPYVMLLFSVAKRFYGILSRKSGARPFYLMSAAAVFLLLYSKGLFSYEGWAFFALILPVILKLFEDRLLYPADTHAKR